MAITITPQNKYYLGGAGVVSVYNFTAAGSGDTLSITINGPQPYFVQFMDANSNEVNGTPPTFGAWTTTNGASTSTLTANSGGVLTNGRMILFSFA